MKQNVKDAELTSNAIVDDTCELGDDVELVSVTVGRFTSIGRHSRLEQADVGPFCSLSWNVTIGWIDHSTITATTHDFPVSPTSNFFEGHIERVHPRVTVGADVWIGCNAVVAPGVRIGNGAVVGAGAVVIHDVRDYEIVAGVPAGHLRYRCPPDIAARLTAVAWWNWPTRLIADNVALFRQPVANVIDRVEEIGQHQLYAERGYMETGT
jgi:virginiamycin A acetyltransferase